MESREIIELILAPIVVLVVLGYVQDVYGWYNGAFWVFPILIPLGIALTAYCGYRAKKTYGLEMVRIGIICAADSAIAATIKAAILIMVQTAYLQQNLIDKSHLQDAQMSVLSNEVTYGVAWAGFGILTGFVLGALGSYIAGEKTKKRGL